MLSTSFGTLTDIRMKGRGPEQLQFNPLVCEPIIMYI
jgi:hypothetical protein